MDSFGRFGNRSGWALTSKAMASFKSVKTKKKYMMSYRWINFCVDRKQIVRDLKKHCLPNLLPWIHQMPMEEFRRFQVIVKGFTNHYKYVLREIVEMLGGRFIDWKNRDSLRSGAQVIFLHKNPSKFRKKIESDAILKSKQMNTGQLHVKDMAWLFKVVSSGKCEF